MFADEMPANDGVTGKNDVTTGTRDVLVRENDVVTRDVPFMASGNLKEPVVPLAGWLRYVGDPESAVALRLYVDSCFEEWLEIPADKVITYISGNIRPGYDGRSLIWVAANTMVTKWTVRTAKASFFARDELESRGVDEPLGETGGYGATAAPPRGKR
jgi:hypothetical protein